MKIIRTAIVMAVVALARMAQADGIYDINFTDGGANVGSGQIDIESGYAVSGYFNVTAGLAIGSYSLYTAAGTGIYSSPLTSPSGSFYYDNAVYLTSNPQYPVNNPLIDYSGLLFNNGGGNEINFWANADDLTSYTFDAYIVGTGYIDPNGFVGALTIAPAPEPSTAFFGLLFLVSGGAVRFMRKAKTQ